MPLGEVCSILDSQRIPINSTERNQRIAGKSNAELFPYYGATGKVGHIDGFLFDGEFVLVGEDGAPFMEPNKGVSYLVRGKFWVNNHAHILAHPTSNEFLCYYLRQIDYSTFVTGTTRLKLNQAELRRIPLPLPPLNEQKRIVAKIEELFSELDAGEESLRKARGQLGVYRQSLLKQAFEGKLTAAWREQNSQLLESPEQLLARIQVERAARYEQKLTKWETNYDAWENGGEGDKRPAKPRKPNGISLPSANQVTHLPHLPPEWSWMAVENCVVEISDGPFGSNLKSSDYVGSGVRVVRLENIGAGEFIAGKESFISHAKYEKLKRHTVRPGDIVVASFISDVVRAALIPPSIAYAVNKADCFQVHCFGKSLAAQFLLRCLGSRYFFKQLEQLVHGVGRPRINTTQLGESFFPLCSLAEQQEIVRLLDEQFTVIEQNEREIDTALKHSEALRQSILKKVFSGQLVAQDPADEPAAVLLERIRAKREAPKESHRKLTRSPKAKPAQEIEEKTVPAITPVQTRKPKPASTPGKTDLQAGLVALAIAAHENGSEHLDHVKVGKIVHLCDVIARLQLDRHPVKAAAGPNDFLQAKKVEHRAKMQGWFTVKKEPGAKAYIYQPGRNFDRLVHATEARLGSRLQTLRDLIGDLASMSVREVELVATVHAAWNNLILGGESQPTEEAIVKEARENWHPDKRRIPRERFFEAIAWIEEAEVVPNGVGCLVKAKHP